MASLPRLRLKAPFGYNKNNRVITTTGAARPNANGPTTLGSRQPQQRHCDETTGTGRGQQAKSTSRVGTNPSTLTDTLNPANAQRTRHLGRPVVESRRRPFICETTLFDGNSPSRASHECQTEIYRFDPKKSERNDLWPPLVDVYFSIVPARTTDMVDFDELPKICSTTLIMGCLNSFKCPHL